MIVQATIRNSRYLQQGIVRPPKFTHAEPADLVEDLGVFIERLI